MATSLPVWPGTISIAANSTAVVGTGSVLTEGAQGAIIVAQLPGSAGVFVGQFASDPADDTHATLLVAPKAAITDAPYVIIPVTGLPAQSLRVRQTLETLASLPTVAGQMAAASEAALVDTDKVPFLQAASGNLFVRTWANFKAQLNAALSFLPLTGGILTGGLTIANGSVSSVGPVVSGGVGGGGISEYISDDGLLRWAAGILGIAGYKKYALYDNINERVCFTVDETTGAFDTVDGQLFEAGSRVYSSNNPSPPAFADITAITDANTLLTAGMYAVGGTWTGSVYAGTQGINQGYLLVIPSNNVAFCSQLWTSFGGIQYLRTMQAGTWGPWSKLFGQLSILGSVSQSSGVPTGAIIESGSNASGSYVRFADGTQICWVTQSLGSKALTLASGNVFYGGPSNSGSWPAAFVASPGVMAGVATGGGLGWPTQATNQTATAIPLYYLLYPTSTTTTCTLYMTAIGRWF